MRTHRHRCPRCHARVTSATPGRKQLTRFALTAHFVCPRGHRWHETIGMREVGQHSEGWV